jgi:hypothetical protein
MALRHRLCFDEYLQDTGILQQAAQSEASTDLRILTLTVHNDKHVLPSGSLDHSTFSDGKSDGLGGLIL